jgi:hypothetical protein
MGEKPILYCAWFCPFAQVNFHGRMARCGHGLPKVLPGLALPYPSTPYGWATPETAVSGMAQPQGGRPAVVFFPLVHPMLYAYI